MMRKKNNNMRNRSGGHGGGHSGGGRRYHGSNNSGGGGNRGGNDSGNLQRQKHHATQMREKYSNMARDAQSNGDRVDVEYYLQHVDHYTRVLTDIGAIEAERFAQQREQQQANPPAEGGDASGSSDQQSGNQGGDTSGGTSEPVSQSHQPRMTRPPRHQSQPQQAAPDANDNSEIPLPGSALPAI